MGQMLLDMPVRVPQSVALLLSTHAWLQAPVNAQVP
jgi:hypothetical protein